MSAIDVAAEQVASALDTVSNAVNAKRREGEYIASLEAVEEHLRHAVAELASLGVYFRGDE